MLAGLPAFAADPDPAVSARIAAARAMLAQIEREPDEPEPSFTRALAGELPDGLERWPDAPVASPEEPGESVPTSREVADYKPGDIVIWSLANADKHIGIIVPGPGDRRAEPWVVHNRDAGPVWENCLFDSKITGHYRFFGEKVEGVKPQS